jgi:hypothetical protein
MAIYTGSMHTEEEKQLMKLQRKQQQKLRKGQGGGNYGTNLKRFVVS